MFHDFNGTYNFASHRTVCLCGGKSNLCHSQQEAVYLFGGGGGCSLAKPHCCCPYLQLNTGALIQHCKQTPCRLLKVNPHLPANQN